MFAGIWDYSDVEGEAVPSFAILTDEPNEVVVPYHDRMPVVLGDVERWLSLDTTLASLSRGEITPTAAFRPRRQARPQLQVPSSSASTASAVFLRVPLGFPAGLPL
jgi:putative SOS response-associated peptidase YedK